MEVIAVLGPPGAGKSALAAYVALREHKRGRKVISNMKLAFDYEPLRPPKEVSSLVAWPELSSGFVVIDELPAWADSYTFFSKRNRAVSWTIAQGRKRHVDVIYTAQLFHMVTKRLRELTTAAIILDRRRGDVARGHLVKLAGGIKYGPNKGVRLYLPSCYSLFDSDQIIMPLDD